MGAGHPGGPGNPAPRCRPLASTTLHPFPQNVRPLEDLEPPLGPLRVAHNPFSRLGEGVFQKYGKKGGREPVRGAPTVCPWARPTSASRNLALSVQHSNTLLSNLPYLFQVVIVGPPVLFQPRPEKLLV